MVFRPHFTLRFGLGKLSKKGFQHGREAIPAQIFKPEGPEIPAIMSYLRNPDSAVSMKQELLPLSEAVRAREVVASSSFE